MTYRNHLDPVSRRRSYRTTAWRRLPAPGADEAGFVAATVTALVMSLFLVAGLVYDGGLTLAARRQAFNEAASAARAGAQAISGSTLAGGPVVADPAGAVAAAQAYLSAAGHAGSATVSGDMVEVTVVIPYRTVILGIAGIRRAHGHRLRSGPRRAGCPRGRAMRPATRPNDSRPSLDLVRGIFAVGAIALLLVGVPLLALPRLGWPLPHGMPAPADLLDALVHRAVSFSVLLRAAAAVLWLAWGVLAACIVVEAVAWARRREARRLNGVGGVQRLAATLVATAVLVLPSLPRLSARPASATTLPFPSGPAAAVAVRSSAWTASITPEVSASPETPEETSRATTTTPQRYVVQRYDCLWDIAERHLGDPYRWPEIAALTADVVQPDGRTAQRSKPDLPGLDGPAAAGRRRP